MDSTTTYYAFDAQQLVAQGAKVDVAEVVKNYIKQNDTTNILYFDGTNGRQVNMDLRTREGEAAAAYSASSAAIDNLNPNDSKKPRGRPKLGVIGREVTLLPRHWQWLETQRGGSSAALRRLIDEARKSGAEEDRIRQSQDSANRFMYAMAGDLKGFEEAVRALYACDRARFDMETASWPVDIRNCAREFAASAFV